MREQRGDRPVAALDFAGDRDLLAAFPFPHAPTIAVTLQPTTLTIATRLRATGDIAVPVSFGFQPYLTLPGVALADWHIEVLVRERARLDARGSPTGERKPCRLAPRPLGTRAFDDLFETLDHPARCVLSGGGRRLTVTFDAGYPCAQIFAPPGEPVICFEPMTAPTNALVSGEGLRTVAPGGELTATFSIAVHPRLEGAALQGFPGPMIQRSGLARLLRRRSPAARATLLASMIPTKTPRQHHKHSGVPMHIAQCGSRSRPAAVVVFLIPAALLALACSQPPPPQVDVVRPVKTMVVVAGGETRERLLSGTVEASRRVELAFQVPGLLAKLPIREGQNVVKGELIAQLRQDEFESQLKARQSQLDRGRAALAAARAGERPEQRRRLEAQVRAAAARLTNARAELNRFSSLLQSGAISRQEFDTVRTAYLVAQEEHESARQLFEKSATARSEDIDAREAEVRGLEAQVVDANLQLQDATLFAPFDGVIAQRFVEPNQNVRAKQPIVRFQDVDEIDIAVDVPETLMTADIQSADFVQMTAELAGAPGVQFPVRIREVAQQADPTTQTYLMRVAMKVPPGVTVLSGMSATVALTYRRASILGEQILVPISAVLKDATGESVAWVIGKDEVVQRRPVTVGAATGNAIEITDGLQPGDRIAVAGVRFLRDGMTVRDLGDALGAGQS